MPIGYLCAVYANKQQYRNFHALVIYFISNRNLEETTMKRKLILSILMVLLTLGLSGCIITDNSDDYERKEFKSTEAVSKVIISDESADVVFKVADSNELSVEYAEASASEDEWYDISVSNGVLEIEKTESTVGVTDNSLIISMPNKEYEEISVETINGDIIFEEVNASIYRCNLKNGDIRGTIQGNSADYLCVISVENGDSTLESNAITSTKIIELNVKNGDIEVEFVQ